MLKCMRCGHDLILGGNFMLSEIGIIPEDADPDDDAIITTAQCDHCGAYYEIHDTPENAKSDYPYWQEVQI